MENLLYLRLKDSHHSSAHEHLSEKVIRTFERLNVRDMIVYEAAKQRFEADIAKEEGFDEEVAEFKERLDEFQERCKSRFAKGCSTASMDNIEYLRRLRLITMGFLQ